MRRLNIPLLAQLVTALLLMALLPLGITFYQFREQAEVVASQARDRHLQITKTSTVRVEAFIDLYQDTCSWLAKNPVVAEGGRAAGQILTGAVSSQSDTVAAGLFDAQGETVMLAQRFNIEEKIGPVFGALPESTEQELLPEVLTGSDGKRYLRTRSALPDGIGYLVVIADGEELESYFESGDVAASTEMLLVDWDRNVLAGGDQADLDGYPEEVFGQRTQFTESWTRTFRNPNEEFEIVAGRAGLERVPWLVISRQRAAEAEKAKERLEKVGLAATVLSVSLTLIFSAIAFFTVIRPLRRMLVAQEALTGKQAEAGVSEIAQLEASFELLRQRVEEEADLTDVFLGRYQVTEMVGSGAMGSVFRGWDPKLKRAVALKTIRLIAENVDKDKLLTSLRDEAAISANIHHPNVVTVYDIEDRGNTAFIAMEYVEGVNLRALLRKRRRLTYQEVIPIGAALARGLAIAHENFLVHHDVKPANLLLGFDGSVKLTDFGVSQSLSHASRQNDVICGTPGYLAPECFEGQGYTPSSDVWAFGVLLWESVAGYNPFRGSNLRVTVSRTMGLALEPLHELYEEVPKEFSDLVHRLLVKDPAIRPADCSMVANELEDMCLRLELHWIPDFSDVVQAPKKDPASSHAPTEWVPYADSSENAATRYDPAPSDDS